MPIALIAGEGSLPEEIAMRLDAGGEKPMVYALREDCESLYRYASDVIPVFKTELAATLKDMAARGIRHVMFAGFVPKTLMYRPEMLDDMARKLVEGLENRDDHSLLGSIVAVFERAGFEVTGYTDILKDLIAPLGFIAGRSPTEAEASDVAYGIQIAREVIPLSFGQSVVVNRRSVVAVEAMEGTDATILRSGALCRRGVLVKMIKQGQDARFDIPVVGPETLRLMKKAGLTCLAVHAGWTIVMSPDEFAATAREHDIAVAGIDY
ncbi:MAG: UDP-2,3-diacylglucosamine diphosphatase LpxI [Synergistaceae bacterium]|jgi:DUF1009 family protein|nr:UDP-2,3-diacylglucosamine diphosphatase LpxI [Synergistaceae bacterium]